jgi:hypothetical protein
MQTAWRQAALPREPLRLRSHWVSVAAHKGLPRPAACPRPNPAGWSVRMVAEGRGASQGRSCREGVKALYSSGANQTLGTQLGGPLSTLLGHSTPHFGTALPAAQETLLGGLEAGRVGCKGDIHTSFMVLCASK